MFLGKENHAHAIFTRGWKINSLLGHLGHKILVRNLQKNTSTVAHQRIGTHGASMIKIAKNLQPLLNNVVAFLTLDMSNESYAAGIMFHRRLIRAMQVGLRS